MTKSINILFCLILLLNASCKIGTECECNSPTLGHVETVTVLGKNDNGKYMCQMHQEGLHHEGNYDVECVARRK